ncbi:MAG: 2-isopropylmalate synthase [Helicobacteraceae bacterium]|jgi:2-isopropylmalate synthase|nr:2-isopropylmalate synthase [Helicobacteraceae bacterium]
MKRITVFDTTLRDGEQEIGAAMNIHEKVTIARSLERLGVDVIEAGFPIASKVDFQAVSQIAAGASCVVCALARAKEADIVKAAQALKNAQNPRIHIFLATSDLHLTHKLRITRGEAIERAIKAVRFAKKFTSDVQFSFEDATRSDPEFLRQMIRAVIGAGALTINAPDTVGFLLPEETVAFFGAVVDAAEGKAVVSTHTHNDLGLATANAICAIEAGAAQFEATINGIGERAGNAALEEIAMIIAAKFAGRFHTGIHTKLLSIVSDEVSRIAAIPKAPNKAIVGENAFSHGSGIHQDGMMKHAGTYEIFPPNEVGRSVQRIVLTRHSGTNAVRNALKEMGIELSAANFDALFAQFMERAESVKIVPSHVLKNLAISLR